MTRGLLLLLAALVAAPGLVLAQMDPGRAGPAASGMMAGEGSGAWMRSMSPADRMRAIPGAPAETGTRPPAPSLAATSMATSPMDHPHERSLFRQWSVHLLVASAVAAFVIHRLVRRRRRRGTPSANLVTEAVLVVDLAGSTRLATHHGDATAMRARLALRDHARDEAERRGLVFTERTGDGRVMTFRSVRDAVDTVRSLSVTFAATERGPGPALAMHAALTWGELLVDARGGRHGTVLNKAFRLDALAEDQLVHVEGDAETPGLPAENRVLLDEEAAQEAERAGVGVRALGFCRLKGFSGLHRVYAIDGTASSGRAPASPDRVSAALESVAGD